MRFGWILLIAACSGNSNTQHDAGTTDTCESGQPCIVEEYVFISQAGGACVNVTNVEWDSATIHLGDESFPTINGAPGLFCISNPTVTNRADTELWVELQDGRTSNRIDAITPAWIDSIAPLAPQPGDTVTISGGNFGRMFPGGYGFLREASYTLEIERWTDSSIEARVLAHNPGTLSVWVLKIDEAQPVGPPNTLTASNNVTHDVRPKLTATCTVTPGVNCHIAGGAISANMFNDTLTGEVTIDDVAIPTFGANSTALDFPLPALSPGPHTLKVTGPHGLSDSIELQVLGWTRAQIANLSSTTAFHAYDREGTMATTPSGGLVLVTQQVSFQFSDTDNTFYETGHFIGTVGLGAIKATNAMAGKPFETVDTGYTSDGMLLDFECSRPRIAATGTAVYYASRLGAIGSISDGTDGVPPRPCWFATPYRIIASEKPYSASAAVKAVAPTPGGTTGGTAGLVHVDNWIWLAARNDTDQETELYRFYAPTGYARELTVPGRGTLHAAGAQVYLAGGEPGFDGRIHQFWLVEEQLGEPKVLHQRELPLIEAGITPARQPLFAGADDGSLYAGYISSTGTLEIARVTASGTAWEAVATVSDSVPGVPAPAVLLANPSALEIVDLEILNGRVYLLSQHDDGTRVGLRVFHHAQSGWLQTHEELASWFPLDYGCVGPYANVTDVCGSDSGINGCGIDDCSVELRSWRPRPGNAAHARMHASDGALWVMYETRYDDSVYIGALGEDMTIAAKLTAEPTDPS